MKNYFEKINEMKNNIEVSMETTQEQYLNIETDMVSLFSEYIKDAKVSCGPYGSGTILNVSGKTVEDIVLEIDFAGTVKKFLLATVMANGFIKFDDIIEIGDAWDSVLEVHTDLTRKFKDIEFAKKQNKKEEEKKVEAAKKAEEKYQKAKERAIRDFEDRVNNTYSELSTVNEFYYALGWLASHMGSLTAILPDYLGSAFESHFGSETPKTLVDSRAKTSGGYAKQWSFEFKCGIKNLKNTVVPACIEKVTTDFNKGIHNTSFLWDLIDNYGFQFSKKQDIDKIKEHIPSQFIQSFEEGLTA